MAYYLNLFSPETWTSFTERGADVTGFVTGMRGQAEQTIKRGDIMLCYMTKLSRWCGAIRIVSNAYTDPTPLFGVYETYPVRFRVESIVLLEPDFTIPLRDEALGNLSLMRPREGRQPAMDGFIRRSLREFPEGDGATLLEFIKKQSSGARRHFPLEPAKQRAFERARISVISVMDNVEDESDTPAALVDEPSAEFQSYTIDNIVDEGCFVEPGRLSRILARLRARKNVILQGPPGTGKTWLAKKIAYALIGKKDSDKLRSIQFHPNLSYEDFVRGYRPSDNEKLKLVDGPFVEMIEVAKDNENSIFVLVIEEINRGNPAQILGEMLTLLEADKRKPDEALELTHRREKGERVYIPQNLHVIGTMNIADRSLAMVDFALRRRFAFFDLEPTFGDAWQDWMREKFNLDTELLASIGRRMDALNRRISSDRSLGPQFRVGHSYFSPDPDSEIGNPEEWFSDIVETEISPLLEEYWFDQPESLKQAKDELLSEVP